jgi:hypothetical protein
VRKYLRSDIVEPKFKVADRTSKLDPEMRARGFQISHEGVSRILKGRRAA